MTALPRRRSRAYAAAVPHPSRFAAVALLLLAGTLSACAPGTGNPAPAPPASSSAATSSAPALPPQPDWSSYSGALVDLRMDSTVGVVLDEMPEGERERYAESLLSKPASFWENRARRQVRLTSLRLSFRNGFYPKGTKWQLPLPPEKQWSFTLRGAPGRRRIDGHDVIATDYAFAGTLLSDATSPGKSEPMLRAVGGTWDEPFVFPVDPEFIFQRTGFACMNEGQFPPNSMDAEESDLFYDHGCTVERALSNTGCHQTAMPKTSCLEALTAKIGKVKTAMRFTRLPWDARLADRVRTGDVTTMDGPDLVPDAEEFRQHRFTYRYIPADSCTLEERCVGGTGWRKLLMFPTADLNAGAQPLDIGTVDYFLKTNGSVLSRHGLFEYSACHEHYHFTHYGEFSLGQASGAVGRKNGFCMQPTARLSNNELSPLRHPYIDCVDQGVAPGWIDEYKMGLECQWLDVTDVRAGQTLPLKFTTNPDNLLCEGTLLRDAEGHLQFGPTTFKTLLGLDVEKPLCDAPAATAANNSDTYDVTIPQPGESYVTQPCREGLAGVLRNCGWTNHAPYQGCVPGRKTVVRCTVNGSGAPQAVRICEASALSGALPCTYNDALATDVVQDSADITFTCPAERDAGAFSFMSGPLVPGEGEAGVTCEVR